MKQFITKFKECIKKIRIESRLPQGFQALTTSRLTYVHRVQVVMDKIVKFVR